MIDKESPLYNGERAYMDLNNHLSTYKNYFNSSNLMILFGDDFNWENAQQNYYQLDAIITEFRRKNLNLNSTTQDVFNVKYSTPSEYVRAVKEELKGNITNRTGDFFPYSDDVNLFWTGYFTTRPNLKREVRETQSQTQAASEIFTFKNLEKITTDQIRQQDQIWTRNEI